MRIAARASTLGSANAPPCALALRWAHAPVPLADAIDVGTRGLDELNSEKEVAQYLRSYFVNKYGGVWHCVVGRNFGSFVTHEAKHHIYFYRGQTAILLFKTG